MENNRRVLDLWLETMRAELEELVRVPVTAQSMEEIPLAPSAYRSQLLFEGSVHGVMYVTASASSLVQLSQIVAGEPVDPRAAWTEEGLEAWQIWLTSTSGKLAVRLSEEVSEGSPDACSILLRDTTAVDGLHLASGNETTASGSAIQQWILRAGETEFAISGSVQVKFSGEEAPSVFADSVSEDNGPHEEPQAEIPSAEIVGPGEMEASTSEPTDEVPSAGQSTLPQENRTSPHASGNASHAGAPANSQKSFGSDCYRSSEPPNRQRLDLLMDIELEATLRFGALELPLREVLELGPGDVLPLDRHVREPVELVVGDRIVAKGEVVLVAGNFALHVTEVAEPRRRLETIRCLF